MKNKILVFKISLGWNYAFVTAIVSLSLFRSIWTRRAERQGDYSDYG